MAWHDMIKGLWGPVTKLYMILTYLAHFVAYFWVLVTASISLNKSIQWVGTSGAQERGYVLVGCGASCWYVTA